MVASFVAGILVGALGATLAGRVRRRIHALERLARQIMHAMNLPGNE